MKSETKKVRLQPPPCNRTASRKRRRLVEKAGIKETPPSFNRPPFFYPKIVHLPRGNRSRCLALMHCGIKVHHSTSRSETSAGCFTRNIPSRFPSATTYRFAGSSHLLSPTG